MLLGAMGAAMTLRRLRSAALVAALAASAAVPFAKGDGWLPDEAAIHTNWASTRRYDEIAAYLRAHLGEGESVALSGEAGTLAFESRRRLYDRLTDRTELIPWLDSRLETGGPWAWLIAVNYRHLAIPRRRVEPRWHLSPPGGHPAEGWQRLVRVCLVSSHWTRKPGYIRLWCDSRAPEAQPSTRR